MISVWSEQLIRNWSSVVCFQQEEIWAGYSFSLCTLHIPAQQEALFPLSSTSLQSSETLSVPLAFFFPRFLHKGTTANPSENFSCFICSHLQRLSFLHALLHFFPRSFSMASAWDRGFYYMENFTPFPFPIHYIPGPLDLRALWLSLAPWFSLSITGTYGELLQQHSTYSSSPAMWHSCGTFISKGFQTLSSLCFHVHAWPSSFSEM